MTFRQMAHIIACVSGISGNNSAPSTPRFLQLSQRSLCIAHVNFFVIPVYGEYKRAVWLSHQFDVLLYAVNMFRFVFKLRKSRVVSSSQDGN